MAQTYPDQEFVEYVVKSIVNNPDDVSTKREVDEMGVLITLKVHPTDMGGVIGRQGATARALRTLLRVVGAKNNARVNLKIEEPEGGRMSRTQDTSSQESGQEEQRKEESAPEKSQSVDDAIEELKL